MANKRPTMNDVAKLAGVTQATVSYVVNNSANISDEVKARVNEAIKQLNYSPNFNARALKTNSSNIIGIILPDIVNQYYSRMVEYLEYLLIQSNHHTMVYTTSYNASFEKDIIQRLLSLDVRGVIVLYQLTDANNWDTLKKSGKKIIALEGGSYCTQIGIPCIRTDSFSGGYMATNYLLSQGAKRIAYIHQTAIIESLYDRFLGYTKAMKDADLYQPEDVYYMDNTADRYKEWERIGNQIAALPYDAIISTSDLIAFGIIRQLLQHGIHVPEDMRIIGYDNIPLAGLFIPALTTMAQPLEDICKQIVSLLFPEEGCTDDITTAFTPKLIIRESA